MTGDRVKNHLNDKWKNYALVLTVAASIGGWGYQLGFQTGRIRQVEMENTRLAQEATAMDVKVDGIAEDVAALREIANQLKESTARIEQQLQVHD